MAGSWLAQTRKYLRFSVDILLAVSICLVAAGYGYRHHQERLAQAREASRWNILFTGPIPTGHAAGYLNESAPYLLRNSHTMTFLNIRHILADFVALNMVRRQGFRTVDVPASNIALNNSSLCTTTWLHSDFSASMSAVPKFQLSLLEDLNDLNGQGFESLPTTSRLLQFPSTQVPATRMLLHTLEFGATEAASAFQTVGTPPPLALQRLLGVPNVKCRIEVAVNGTIIRPRWSYGTTVVLKLGGNATLHTFASSQLPQLRTQPAFHPLARHAGISLLANHSAQRGKGAIKPRAQSTFCAQDTTLVLPPGWVWGGVAHDIAAFFTCEVPSNASRWLQEALAIDVPFLQAEGVKLEQAKAFFHAVGQLLLGRHDIRLSVLNMLKTFNSHHLQHLKPNWELGESTVAEVHACSTPMPGLTKAARKEASAIARSVAQVLQQFPMETRRAAVMDYLFEKITLKLGLFNVFSIFQSCYA